MRCNEGKRGATEMSTGTDSFRAASKRSGLCAAIVKSLDTWEFECDEASGATGFQYQNNFDTWREARRTSKAATSVRELDSLNFPVFNDFPECFLRPVSGRPDASPLDGEARGATR